MAFKSFCMFVIQDSSKLKILIERDTKRLYSFGWIKIYKWQYSLACMKKTISFVLGVLLCSSMVFAFSQFDRFDKLPEQSLPEPQVCESCLDTDFFLTEFFDFESERDISAYQCRRYLNTTLPHELEDCINLNDITSNFGFDYDDEVYTGDTGWAFRSLFHVFHLENVGNPDKINQISVEYVSFNANYNNERVHSLYIKNFETGNWEMIGENVVMPRSESAFEFSTPEGNQERYVSAGKIWFASTDNLIAFGAINSDYFRAELDMLQPEQEDN